MNIVTCLGLETNKMLTKKKSDWGSKAMPNVNVYTMQRYD